MERKGFSVQGVDREALFAKKGEDTLLVAWKLDAPVSEGEARLFIAAMDQVHATSAVLVAPRGAERGAKDLAAAKGVEVWPEGRLVLEVGQALLADAMDASRAAPAPPPAAMPAAAPAPVQEPARGSRPFRSLVAQAATAASGHTSGAAMFMPSKPRAPQPASEAPRVLGYAWGGGLGSGGPSNAGVAQVRNGRRARAVEAPSSDQPTLAQVAQHDDVEVIVTPRRKPQPAEAAAAAATPTVVVGEDDHEVITSKPSPKAAAPAKAAPAPAPVHEDEGYEIITSKPAKAKEPQAVRVPSASAAAGASTTLRIATSAQDAQKATGKSGSVRLTLVPHVAFEYDLHMEREGMVAPVTAKGAILASSLTGELRTVDRLDYEAAEPADARKEPEKLHAVDVYDKVKALLSKTYSKTLSVEREVAGNTIMQNVKMAPEVEEMGIEHKGIVLLPVWEITGSSGVTRVDATTGNVL